jgi:hypothetical protein
MSDSTDSNEVQSEFQVWATRLKQVLSEGFREADSGGDRLELGERYLLGAFTLVAEISLLVGKPRSEILEYFRLSLDQAEKSVQGVRERFRFRN